MIMHRKHSDGYEGVGTVGELHERFKEAGIRRACVVLRNGQYRLFVDEMDRDARPLLPVLENYLPDPSDWQHEAVFIGRPADAYPEIDTLFFAFVHNLQRGLAQGGLRLRDYTRIGELDKLFEDGLRLAQGMTLKNAMAELWWGGGKGIIAELPELVEKIGTATPDNYPDLRAILFEEYGRFVSELGGIYYTAADMNTNGEDMRRVLRKTRFVTCLPMTAGGSADPSPYTAKGVFRAIEASWELLSGTPSLKGVRVAVQGIGKVGIPLVVDLLEAGATVWVGDKKEEAVNGDQTEDAFARLHKKITAARSDGRAVDFGRLELVPLTDDLNAILRQEVDVISPCAAGQTINSESIGQFAPTVRLVCGAANNMLGDEPRDAELLHERGICYVPDFVCNRMGIMNCADEWMGYLADDTERQIEKVVEDVVAIVGGWMEGIPTLRQATEMALKRLDEPPPLDRLNGRGKRLLEHYLTAKGLEPGH